MLNQILNYYPIVTEGCNVNAINSGYAYYFGDDLSKSQGGVGIKADAPLIYYDIRSAFPSLCRLILKDTHPNFITHMDSIEDKRKKLIYISTHVNEIKDGFLRDLNAWAKIVVFSKVFNSNENIQILEFKKDSLLCKGTALYDEKIYELELLLNHGFEFHTEQDISEYMRFDGTSIYVRKDGKVEVKGKYKGFPPYLYDVFISNLNGMSEIDLINLKNIYSRKYYLYLQAMGENLDYFYKFGGGYMTKFQDKLTAQHDESCGSEILLRIVYPIMQLHESKPIC